MKPSVITGVALFLVASLAVVGVLAYTFPAGPPASPTPSGGNSPGGKGQSLVIAGNVNVKVYAEGGALVSNWNGPAPMNDVAVGQLVGCIVGSNGGQPSEGGLFYGSCFGFINELAISFDSQSGPCVSGGATCSSAESSAKNYLLPLNCWLYTSGAEADPCTGWETQAIFGPDTFTNTNCGSSCNIEYAMTGVLGGSGNLADPFDYLCTTTYSSSAGSGCSLASIASVSPGQTLVVTITYTIS